MLDSSIASALKLADMELSDLGSGEPGAMERSIEACPTLFLPTSPQERFLATITGKNVNELHHFDMADILPSFREVGPGCLSTTLRVARLLLKMTFSSVLRCVHHPQSHPPPVPSSRSVRPRFLTTHTSRWNHNFYLFPLWCLGVIVRYSLFPFRVLFWALSTFLAAISLIAVQRIGSGPRCRRIADFLGQTLSNCWVASWLGVVRFHGVKPTRKANQVFVANHTSMIDFVLLQQLCTFATVGQKHVGFVGFFQSFCLGYMGNIWFNRGEQKNRAQVARRLRQHLAQPDGNPLLLFPEGTCVNNLFCVQFKKGAFELDADVIPVAISYQKAFCDCFWNSRKQGFVGHILYLMTRWCLVADVWFLEPQHIQPGESGTQFADRVKNMICQRAGLVNVPYDGYLKYWKPSPKYLKHRQMLYARSLLLRLQDAPLISHNGQSRKEDVVLQNVKRSLSHCGISSMDPPDPVVSDEGTIEACLAEQALVDSAWSQDGVAGKLALATAKRLEEAASKAEVVGEAVGDEIRAKKLGDMSPLAAAIVAAAAARDAGLATSSSDQIPPVGADDFVSPRGGGPSDASGDDIASGDDVMTPEEIRRDESGWRPASPLVDAMGPGPVGGMWVKPHFPPPPLGLGGVPVPMGRTSPTPVRVRPASVGPPSDHNVMLRVIASSDASTQTSEA